MSIAAVLFDFDGTLVESLDVKVAAFRALYAPFGRDVEEAAAKHYRSHTGVPRSVRIRQCHERFLGRTPKDREVKVLSDQFGAMVEDEVVASDWVPGARAFLEAYHEHLPLFVVSATPQEELERIIQERCMTDFFENILGSPPDKTAAIHDIISTYWFEPTRVVMVGDGRADFDAAEANGVHFVGRLHGTEGDPFPSGTMTLPDLTRLSDMLDEFIVAFEG